MNAKKAKKERAGEDGQSQGLQGRQRRLGDPGILDPGGDLRRRIGIEAVGRWLSVVVHEANPNPSLVTRHLARGLNWQGVRAIGAFEKFRDGIHSGRHAMAAYLVAQAEADRVRYRGLADGKCLGGQ